MANPRESDPRTLYLRAAVALGAFVVITTELLSFFAAISRPALIVAWMLAAGIALAIVTRSRLRFPRPGIVDALLIAAIAVVLGVILVVALASPPNSADAMAYHLPRVLMWAQQRSVRFFATPYLNQIMLQPFGEYLMLHTYVLSGGDRFVNLAQWFGCVTAVIAVSLIARSFGAGPRGQIVAALVCATLPNGILQATGAKNDYVMAAWLAATVFFLLEVDMVFAGLALGLAIGTKATAYLYAPPLLLAIAALSWRKWKVSAAGTVAICALALNAPQFARNVGLSRSPLGFDGAFGDGRFHWRNETFGWRQTISNLIRNSTEQLAFRDPRWNQKIYDWAVAAHRIIGADVNDPATTWTWSTYAPPRNANHEVNAPNRWQIPLFAACFAALALRREWRRMIGYATAIVAGFVLFCFYLKWQPFMARMFLPLFVLACPIAGVVLERIRPPAIPVLLCFLLLLNARPALFQNWVRPLRGERSVLRTPRDLNYFADMTQWNNRDSYLASMDAAAKLDCAVFGVDINNLQLEYPFEALLKERKPAVRFVHTGVSGPSAKYASTEAPCAVLCLDCAADPARLASYHEFPEARRFGAFVLFARH